MTLPAEKDQDFAAWSSEGENLARTHRNILWNVAEWMQRGVLLFGDAAENVALIHFGRSLKEVAEATELARRFPAEVRHDTLTFGHYKVAAILPDDEALTVLSDAAAKRRSVSETKKLVNRVRQSDGGDLHNQMAGVSMDELYDKWAGEMERLWNRCPNGAEGREIFLELAEEAEGGLIEP